MELLILEIILLAVVVVLLFVFFRKNQENTISRNELIEELKKRYDTLEINQTNDENLPEIEFMIEGRKFHIYNKLIRRRRYLNIYNEYLEISSYGALESARIMANAKSLLKAKSKKSDGKITIDISCLNDYQQLLKFIENFNN